MQVSKSAAAAKMVDWVFIGFGLVRFCVFGSGNRKFLPG